MADNPIDVGKAGVAPGDLKREGVAPDNPLGTSPPNSKGARGTSVGESDVVKDSERLQQEGDPINVTEGKGKTD